MGTEPAILIVDDDPGFRRTLADILTMKGYASADASTGQAALEQVSQRCFAVALIDLRLPDVGGLEIVDQIKRDSPSTECIVLTGFATQSSAIEAVNVGAYSYVQKPYDVDQLLLTIRRAIERREAEEETRRLKAFNESIVQNVADGIVVEDPQGTITFVNPAMAALLGREPDEILQQDWTMLFPPDQHATVRAAREQRMGDQIEPYETELVGPEGRRIPVLTSGSPRFQDGQFGGILHVYTDITKRKRAERALRSERDFAESLIETAPVVVLVLDSEDLIVRFNSYMEEISGYTLREVQGRDWFDLFLPEREEAATRRCFQQEGDGRTGGNVIPIITKDGRQRDVEWYVKTLKDVDGGGTGLLAIGRDVTEEQEIRQRAEQQERLAAVGQLAAGIAHDFNNILATIILYTQLLARNPGLTPKGHQRLEVISQQAKHASQLIEQILDFSRRSMLERRTMDLLPLFKELTKLLDRTLSESIQVELKHEMDAYVVNGDPARIQQAMMNLALNARDAMPEGGMLSIGLGRIRVASPGKAPIPEMETGEWIMIEVADTGTGIPPAVQARIYEPFFTTKEPGQGSGLGLSQVYGIVKQHEGHIKMHSQVGKGTAFTLYLPALHLPQGESSPEGAEMPTAGQGERILLVEDDPVARDALCDTLKMLNYQVVVAADGQEAMGVYQQEADNLALVLSDLVMPKMGGRELVRKLRKLDPQLKALAITGYALAEDIRQLKEDGIHQVIQKPFEVSVLAAAIRQVLDQEQSPPPIHHPPDH